MEANDISMMAFHHEFCALLKGLLEAPWMPDDNWTVKEGPWKPPPSPPPPQPEGAPQPQPQSPSPASSAPPKPPAVLVPSSDVDGAAGGADAPAVVTPRSAPSTEEGSFGLREGSRWDSVRARVVNAPMSGETERTATIVALRSFSGRAKMARFKGLSRGLFAGGWGRMLPRQRGEEDEHAEYVRKMQRELFIIPALPKEAGPVRT